MSALDGVLDEVLSGLLEAGEAVARSYIREGEGEPTQSPIPVLEAVARIAAPGLARLRAAIPVMAAEREARRGRPAEVDRHDEELALLRAQVRRMEDDADDLAEVVDQIVSAVHREDDDGAGLPAGAPIPAAAIDVYRDAVSYLIVGGVTEEGARLFLARDERAPAEDAAARAARRVILRAKRQLGHTTVASARRLLTVPAIFSVLYRCRLREMEEAELLSR